MKNMNKKDVTKSLKTVGDFIRWGASVLGASDVYFGHGTENPWDEAAAVVYHVIQLPHDIPQPIDACRLTMAEREKIFELIEQRIVTRKPLPYLTNTAWFCDMAFYVDENVLIPRSPIGELINNEFKPWLMDEPRAILDMCTGSGCIALACAATFPEAEIIGTDISPDALNVAMRNLEAFGMRDQVSFIESDVFDQMPEQTFDLIISNPPYVDEQDMSAIPQEFVHEPELALAAGVDGLDIVHRILTKAHKYLTEEGVLIVEVGNSWEALESQYPDVPFTWIEFESGGHGVFMLTYEQVIEHFS